MSGIERKRLKKAKKELESISERHSGPFLKREIDWKLIRKQLEALESALENGDQSGFTQALQMLVPRLAPPIKLRGKIHRYDNSPKMAPRDLDLLNHIVEQLHQELEGPSPEQPKEQADQQSAAKRDSERPN